MPIYEYRCTVCSHRFDIRQSFQDPPAAQCPRCQGAASRMILPVGVVFKGSGWYSTDHRSSSFAGGNGKGAQTENSDGGGEPSDKAAETPAAASPAEAKAGD